MFLRRQLQPNEVHKNFYMVDFDVVAALETKEATKVYKSMLAVYMRLRAAAGREMVLEINGTECWKELKAITKVANSTLSNCLKYMHQIGVIGYVSIHGISARVYFNIAESSIGIRATPKFDAPVTVSGAPYKEASHEREIQRNTINADAVFAQMRSEIQGMKVELKKANAAITQYPKRVEDYFYRFGIPKMTRVYAKETSKLGVVSKKTEVGSLQPHIQEVDREAFMNEVLSHVPPDIASCVSDPVDYDQLSQADERLRLKCWENEENRSVYLERARKALAGKRMLNFEDEVLKRAQVEVVKDRGYPLLAQSLFHL